MLNCKSRRSQDTVKNVIRGSNFKEVYCLKNRPIEKSINAVLDFMRITHFLLGFGYLIKTFKHSPF